MFPGTFLQLHCICPASLYTISRYQGEDQVFYLIRHKGVAHTGQKTEATRSAMAPFFARRPTQQVVISGQTNGTEADDPASHFDSLLGHGDPFTDPDPDAGSTSTSQYHPDPDVDSLGSLRSRDSHHRHQHVDCIRPYPAILDEQPAQANKLQRRRNQYSYMNPTTPGSSTSSPPPQPAPASSPSHQPTTSIARSKSTRTQPLTTQQYGDHQAHRRQKSYSLSGGPSWLINNPLIEVRRQSSVTGERRETKKLQKEHPTGSARPNMSMNLEEGEKGSGLGVRRKMGKLRDLYRK